MCKEELKNATISIDFTKDFLYEIKFKLKRFTVEFDDKKYFIIEGNKFTDEVFDEINKLKIGSIFTIKTSLDINSEADILVYPIKIMIIEDKNYQEDEK